MWTQEWPTEPGMYWFYGQRYQEKRVELCFLRVWESANSLFLVCEGNIMYKSEAGPVAWFRKIDAPPLPETAHESFRQT